MENLVFPIHNSFLKYFLELKSKVYHRHTKFFTWPKQFVNKLPRCVLLSKDKHPVSMKQHALSAKTGDCKNKLDHTIVAVAAYYYCTCFTFPDII